MPIWGVLMPQAAGEGGARQIWNRREERSQERGSRCPGAGTLCSPLMAGIKHDVLFKHRASGNLYFVWQRLVSGQV